MSSVVSAAGLNAACDIAAGGGSEIVPGPVWCVWCVWYDSAESSPELEDGLGIAKNILPGRSSLGVGPSWVKVGVPGALIVAMDAEC